VPQTALSLKQPWAALLAAGRKTIEVRAWATRFRGPVLIHAARVPDPRPEAWNLVPPELSEAAGLNGGLVGRGVLGECRSYRCFEHFVADQAHHLNDLRWFRSGLFGFVFAELRPLSFVRLPGWMRFFEVPDEVLPPS
jgi:hypothetical protein